MKAPFGLALAALFCSTALHAEPAIERVKLGDNELSCRDLDAEARQMDKMMAEAKGAESGGNATAVAGTAGKVAGGVGLFAQLGGLVGHVAGQVAAGVAQQTGQQSADQAAERGRQALARKEQVSTLFADKGCQESDLSYEPPAQSAKFMKTAYAPNPAGGAVAAAPGPAAPPSALPDNDPDQFFKGKMGGTFGEDVVEVLPNNKRVAVLGFRVAFVTSNTATAQVRASYLPGRDTSGASSKLTATLTGVDAATMQALTDQAYADFLAQLKLAGREVVPPEEMKEFLGGLETTPSSAAQPFAKDVQAMKLVYFAPTGMPLWFNNWDAQWGTAGPFDQANMRRVGAYSYKLNAIAIAPLIVVDFTKMSSSGNQSGLAARTAETGAEMSMRVTHFSTGYVRTNELRNGQAGKGDNGMVQLTNASVVSALEFGSLRKASSEDNSGAKGVFDQLGKSLGMANAGGAARSSTTSVAETNNAAYGAAAGDALRTATGTFAKLFQKYPPR
jgi:hypothetical protein